jgi:antitoxin component YwqK of YwqJK toxin-antitoxin module
MQIVCNYPYSSKLRARFFTLLLCTFFLCTSCQPKVVPLLPDGTERPVEPTETLVRIHVIDQNNLAETITNQEKLNDFAKRDYLDSQPYKKVFRVFDKGQNGLSKSIVTSYYENGQIQQYLECVNGRACGLYREWYSSGEKKSNSHVIAGQADLGEKTPLSWSFDGISEAWDEEGHLLARMCYEKGQLHGSSETFYPSGAKERISYYEKGEPEGKDTLFNEDGSVLEEVSYLHGKREGESLGFHKGGQIAWTEHYSANKLISGAYSLPDGTQVSAVNQGVGLRSLFDEGILSSQQEIQEGFPQGKVSLFEKDGSVEREYFIKDGKKEGRETRFFPGKEKKPRLQIEWKDGTIHGTVKTWYKTGAIESQKEMRGNTKHGLFMAWYPDGSIMLVEEYENNSLRSGRYHKRRDDSPTSQVNNGEGTATLFDENGSITEKIQYHEGKPVAER